MSDGRFGELAHRLADPALADALSDERRPVGAAQAAVLILLSDSDEPDLVFTERANDLRKHAGQISFPGGGLEKGDAGASAAALREAHEEIGLDPAAVSVLGELPATRLPVSRFDVAPVVATWNGDAPIRVASAREVAAIHRWTIRDLASPEFRLMSRHPRGQIGPAWQFGDLFLWGFTAYLTDELLRLGGWEQPWDHTRVVDVPARFLVDRGHPIA
ncbi:CoA pyrophosphatase [Brooklawnia cerclae]|uniref:8-oxo-dGTP pyrophosphatase MutT (NUDIX family) n=1 Tax=Brooklawnia cerclae TaxID=349934 RepID=A0ABX0SFS2_9ACTN|nr:CoA pyrophosphatase [Brooklawnia cerclae]NIH55481.1 8-oxo-dGTP pyrophosphatase MutT (NUDIX family) [Brooklawnia cerclae]